MSESSAAGRWGSIGAVGAMLAGVLAWLGPIGLGGSMPVGGDATQFSMGLMAFLGSSLRAGRLPLWNDLWGFGFPGLAESQMGVYYPPHLILYGLLPVETAYLLSLVGHTAWGALGAWWAARRFGASAWGAALGGFAFASSGFALIHLPHQWAYTAGSWMPWAWGLAWLVARGEGSRRGPWLLSAVLAVQTLPGHFQLAFVTEVSVLAIALASGRRGGLAVGLAWLGMLPLAAMQLWPTARLAALSGSGRDFEYLSGFASTPLHLVSFVAPGLFHGSPLWRPVMWDPFHTSPEEHLSYVGLVPLFLALGAARRNWRDDPATRALVVVAGLTLVLSLGPYVPGFSALIRLPGFSFFRAPARWGLATSLALAILAARGFDALGDWPRPRRSAARFTLGAALATALVVLGFELALGSSRGAGWPAVASTFDRASRALPWPSPRPFRKIMAEAHRPQGDLRVQSALARVDGRPAPSPGPTLADSRSAIYRRELGGSALLMAGLLAASTLARRPRAFGLALAALTLADALALARFRPFDVGPARPLAGQSALLARLAREPRGERSLDPAQNLLMTVGLAPANAYRTLDLPAPQGLLAMARGRGPDPRVGEVLRALGIGLRVLDPFEARTTPDFTPKGWSPDPGVPIADPALAGWLFGADLASAARINTFALLRPEAPPARAWLVPPGVALPEWGMDDTRAILEAFRPATPLPMTSESPERAEVEARVASPGASMVVLSRTYDPEWEARWSGPSGDRPAEVVRVLGGWQGVMVPEPGKWTLHLEYPGRAARLGLTISSTAWSVWLMAFWRLKGPRSRAGEIR